METKKRIVSMDLIRLFACICVTVVHFNASVSGWNNGVFVYPNSIVPNYYLGGGDLSWRHWCQSVFHAVRCIPDVDLQKRESLELFQKALPEHFPDALACLPGCLFL